VLAIIIIHHKLGLDRPVSAWPASLITGPPSCLHAFGLQFSIIFGILLLFILGTVHVTVNVICLFSVSLQLVLLPALPKILHSFISHLSIT